MTNNLENKKCKRKVGREIKVCPIHDDTHYCKFKIREGCNCICTCLPENQERDGGNPTTFMELRLRLDNEEYQRVIGFLMEGGGIGEEIELRVDNAKFHFGTFKAKITEFIPKNRQSNDPRE